MKGLMFLLLYLMFILGIAGSVFCFYRVIWSEWSNVGEVLFWFKWLLSCIGGAVFFRVVSNWMVKLNSPTTATPPNIPPVM